jgi:exopolysaccharide production protein ExoF
MSNIAKTPAARGHLRRVRSAFWAALLLSTAVATPSGAQQNNAGFADGDILKITAYGREDLTGTYSVQPGPVLSLPLIGTVTLANRSPRQLEAELATAWENRLGTPMSITIEYAQRAPVYVLGAVNSPGAYPYREEMTVLQAIAVSGGMQRQLTLQGNVRIDLIRERERRLQAIETLAGAMARRARLIAERDGKTELKLDEPFTLVSKQRMDGLLAQEEALLDMRTRQYMIRERLLAEQVRLGEAEAASYQQQYTTLEGQQAQIGKEAARIRRIPGQQLRAFELEQRATALETTKAAITASTSRTAAAIETARSSIADARESRQREITESLLEAEKSIEQAKLTEAAARAVLSAAGYEQPESTVTFKLIPQGKGEATTVMSSASLRPGDVLDVIISDTDIPAHAVSER